MSIEALLLLIALPLILDEFLQWSPRLAALLIKWNTRRLIPDLQERLREEWLGELEEYPGRLSKLAFAADTARAAYRIDHERRLPGVSIWKPVLVRLFDIVATSLTVFFCLPLLVVIVVALLIESSKGPVFYSRTLVGRDGTLFKVLRFRSERFCSTGVNNRSIVGSIIYRLNADTLPVYFNVLKGDMSLVGPAPLSPEAVRVALKEVPEFERRFVVRPGLTGLAQLTRITSGADAQTSLAKDIEYLQQCGVVTNLKILFRTAAAILFRRK